MNVRLGQTQSLNYDLIDLVLDPLASQQAIVLHQLFEHELVAALRPDVICIGVLILNEVTRFFIYSVVGQMHAEILQVRGSRARILDRCKSGQPIFVDIDS